MSLRLRSEDKRMKCESAQRTKGERTNQLDIIPTLQRPHAFQAQIDSPARQQKRPKRYSPQTRIDFYAEIREKSREEELEDSLETECGGGGGFEGMGGCEGRLLEWDCWDSVAQFWLDWGGMKGTHFGVSGGTEFRRRGSVWVLSNERDEASSTRTALNSLSLSCVVLQA